MVAMDCDELLRRAIATISQSDPLIKLIDQVRLGRMQATDAGLRVIVESWLATYQKVIGTQGLTKQALRRIDPSPRLAVLTENGVLPSDHPAATALQSGYREAVDRVAD